MKKNLGFAAALAVALVALYFFFSSKNRQSGNDAPSIQNPSPRQTAISPNISPSNGPSVLATMAASNFSGTNSSPARPVNLPAGAGERVSDSRPAPELPPETVLQNVRRSVRQYGAMFGGNPVGTNPEITRQLNGGNPKRINFIDTNGGMRINPDGELIDPWGTPYFFHQISGAEMEIHSAGPDKRMWTSDDLVVK